MTNTLIIVSSLAPNMFINSEWGFLQYRVINTKEELQHLLNAYDKVVSYIRHPSTVNFLQELKANIEVIEDPNAEYKYYQFGGEDILTIALSKRPSKGISDIKINGFNDLAIVFWREPQMLQY